MPKAPYTRPHEIAPLEVLSGTLGSGGGGGGGGGGFPGQGGSFSVGGFFFQFNILKFRAPLLLSRSVSARATLLYLHPNRAPG